MSTIRVDRTEHPGGVVCLRINAALPGHRDLDVSLLDCPDVEEALTREFSADRVRIVLDLAGVTHIHSRAFWAIVDAGEKAMAKGGGVVMIHLAPRLKQLTELTSASDAVRVRGTLEEAIRTFAR